MRIDWTEVERLVDEVARQIDKYPIELIIAIPRGGFIPARLLADRLNVQLMMSLPIGLQEIQKPEHGLNVLLVDEICDLGTTLSKIHALRPWWKTAVLHRRFSANFVPDYIGKSVTGNEWIEYPWERYSR